MGGSYDTSSSSWISRKQMKIFVLILRYFDAISTNPGLTFLTDILRLELKRNFTHWRLHLRKLREQLPSSKRISSSLHLWDRHCENVSRPMEIQYLRLLWLPKYRDRNIRISRFNAYLLYLNFTSGKAPNYLYRYIKYIKISFNVTLWIFK